MPGNPEARPKAPKLSRALFCDGGQTSNGENPNNLVRCVLLLQNCLWLIDWKAVTLWNLLLHLQRQQSQPLTSKIRKLP